MKKAVLSLMEEYKESKVITSICKDILESSFEEDIFTFMDSILRKGYLESGFISMLIEDNADKFFKDNMYEIFDIINAERKEGLDFDYDFNPKNMVIFVYEAVVYKFIDMM